MKNFFSKKITLHAVKLINILFIYRIFKFNEIKIDDASRCTYCVLSQAKLDLMDAQLYRFVSEGLSIEN